MNYFDSLPNVNKLNVMRMALIAENQKMFAQFALHCITEGHFTMHDLSAAFGPYINDPNFNTKMCTP